MDENSWGSKKIPPPYMGVVKTTKIDRLSEFSPVPQVFPQFFASYPQFRFETTLF
jgi:hypothetical protein